MGINTALLFVNFMQLVINTMLTVLLVKAKEIFSFQQELSGSTVCFIAEHCKHLKKYSLDGVTQIFDDDIIHIIKKLGRQLTTLTLDGEDLTDVAFSYLNNCTR